MEFFPLSMEGEARFCDKMAPGWAVLTCPSTHLSDVTGRGCDAAEPFSSVIAFVCMKGHFWENVGQTCDV